MKSRRREMWNIEGTGSPTSDDEIWISPLQVTLNELDVILPNTAFHTLCHH